MAGMVDINMVLSALWALFVSLYAVPSIIDIAHSKKLLDTPNHRTSHELLTPRLGGVAIFAGFISAVTIFGGLENGVQQILAGSIIIFFLGVKDDLSPIPIFKKILVQLLAAIIIVYVADLRLTNFHGFLGIFELSPIASQLFSVFLIIALTNSFNLIDGIDGLAGVIVVTVMITLGLLLVSSSPAFALVAFTLAGAVVGFLRYNLHKAKVFMGDTGSLVCGLIVSSLIIHFIEFSGYDGAPGIAVGLLVIPIFDTLRVFTLRVINGKSPLEADKNHLHHRLLDMGLSSLQVVGVLLGVNLLSIAFVLSFPNLGLTITLAIYVATLLPASLVLEALAKRKFDGQGAY